jgi:hypothetical protein
VIAQLGAEKQWIADLDAYLARKEPFTSLVWRAEQSGWRFDEIPTDVVSTLRQFVGTNYSFAGDYRSAELIYPTRSKLQAPAELGYDSLIPATDVVVQASHGRRAVLLNESHGRSETRAANFILIARLIDAGYTHLALEGVSPTAAGDGCGATSVQGSAVSGRGYVIVSDGYYVNDPIFAETVRYALSRGVRVFGYDKVTPGQSLDEREEQQANELACVLDADASSRLIVVGGFAHISERDGGTIPGGPMGRRLAQKTSIDPLTIETTLLLKFGLVDATASGPATDAIYLLRNAAGKDYAIPGYDFTVAVRPIGSRSWNNPSLALGGHRTAVAPESLRCGSAPCLFEAVSIGAEADAVPLDRCITRTSGAACPLYVPAVDHTIQVREGLQFSVLRAPTSPGSE